MVKGSYWGVKKKIQWHNISLRAWESATLVAEGALWAHGWCRRLCSAPLHPHRGFMAGKAQRSHGCIELWASGTTVVSSLLCCSISLHPFLCGGEWAAIGRALMTTPMAFMEGGPVTGLVQRGFPGAVSTPWMTSCPDKDLMAQAMWLRRSQHNAQIGQCQQGHPRVRLSYCWGGSCYRSADQSGEGN